MKLREFLLKKTNALELCAICIDGWTSTTAWIDHEDLFIHHVDRKLLDAEVKKDYWDYLPVVNENNATIKIPCHYIDV